jgi:para-nitrobenzyl esterase
VAVKVAAAVESNGTASADGRAAAARLRAVPAEAFGAIEDKSATLAPGFIVGDRALPRAILGTFQKGAEAKLPLIIGNTSDDGSVALAFGVDPAAVVKKLGAARVVVKSLYPPGLTDAQLGSQTMRDLIFTAFERRISYLHSSRAPTWVYYFSYVADNMRADHEGVAHGADVPFTMGTLDLCGCLAAPPTAADHAAAERTTDRWFDFARTGSPVPLDAAAWPKTGTRDARLLQIDRTDEVRVDFMKRRLNVFIGTLKVLGAFSGGR